MDEGAVPAATTGWDGCSTFYHPGNLGDFLSAAGSQDAFVVACTLGVQVAVHSCHAVGLSLLSWISRHLLQRGYTFENFLV